MDLQLGGKRALVTGASAGLGTAIAKTLAAEGCTVVVHGRDAGRAQKVADEIKASGGKATIAIGDISNDEGARQVADAALADHGGIDIFVHNAGGALHNHDMPTWDKLPVEDYLLSLNTNFIASVRLVNRFAPGMVERGWGRIINISSTAARQALGVLHEYGPAKAALENWGINMSKNLSRHGVTVNTIEPGMYLTGASVEFLQTLGKQQGWPDDLAECERRYATETFPQPVPRLGKPEEMGAVVAFLASPLSGYTTGATWRADGGNSMGV
jgi:NAD(P)-dependent dehydrogenase (short-subunit alcohol dehydrogenase family)